MKMKTLPKDRRDFLKAIGFGAATVAIPFAGLASWSDREEKHHKSEIQNLRNGYELEFLFSGENFLGLGEVKYKGVLLRNKRLPMFAQISTPEAIELVNFKLLEQFISEDEIKLSFSVQKQLGNTMEWMLHTIRNRRNMNDWTRGPENAPDTVFTMIIRPVERKIGTKTIIGFSYQYLFSSENLAIYKITDRGSWEIGGSAIGNEFWMRNGVTDSIKEFSDNADFYSTEWYKQGIENPNIFQFHPLQTQLQGFTFSSSNEGTLITFPGKVAHIRSLFEKWRESHEIVHFHEHCNDLSKKFETVPVEVFFIPGQLNRIGRANLYHEIREMVHEELHEQIGMKRERISTYGVIEEWTEPNFEYYRQRGLPKLLDAGVKTIFIPNQCQNDMNVWGISNMCCNVDYKIADSVDEKKLKNFCVTAKAGGAKVEMWGNTAISSLTERFMHLEGKPKGIQFLPYKGSIMEVLRKAKSPFVRNASNAIEADHYTPRFCALNLRDPDIREYWMKQWKYFHDELGIGGIFLDSSFNMSSDKFHHLQNAGHHRNDNSGKYRPQNEPDKSIQTQYHAHLSWVVEMQKMGYQYCAEDMGVFGINRTGPDLLDRIDSLPIWADCFCDFDEHSVKKAGFEPMAIFFKGLAYRMMWKLFWNLKKDKLELGIGDKKAYDLIKAFNQVTDLMVNREILPGETGVEYSSGKTSVLWAFEDFDYSKDGMKSVTKVLDNNSVILHEGNSFKALALNVYQIEYA
jgi:hypothetical protein